MVWLRVELINPINAATSPGQACDRLQTKANEARGFLELLQVFFS